METEETTTAPTVEQQRLIRLFLSDVKELRMKINLRQSVADAKPLFARVVTVWNDPRYNEILGELRVSDSGGDYTIDRAMGCLNAGLRFAASMSGHAFGWVDEGLRIIEQRLFDKLNEKKQPF